MAKAYFLNEQDRAAFNALMEDYQKRFGNPLNRPYVPDPNPAGPVVYIAKTPSGGIPARTSDILPGYAECDIYQPIQIYPESAPDLELDIVPQFTQFVHNFSDSPIPGGVFILVGRERFGYWFHLSDKPTSYIAHVPGSGIDPLDTSGSTGTGTGTLGGLDDVPGYATCDLYTIDHTGSAPVLTMLSQQVRVYNVSNIRIRGGAWIVITRDPYGKWLAPYPEAIEGTPVYVLGLDSTGKIIKVEVATC